MANFGKWSKGPAIALTVKQYVAQHGEHAPGLERWHQQLAEVRRQLETVPGVSRVFYDLEIAAIPVTAPDAGRPPLEGPFKINVLLGTRATVATRAEVSRQATELARSSQTWLSPVTISVVDVRDSFFEGTQPRTASLLAAIPSSDTDALQLHWLLSASNALKVRTLDAADADVPAPAEAARALSRFPSSVGPMADVRFNLGGELAEDVLLFQHWMGSVLPDYSVEEIRRVLALHQPHLTEEYVSSKVLRELRQDRPVDAWGAEPHFHLSAHLAHFMLGAGEHTLEQEAMDRFLRDSRTGALHAFPNLKREDLKSLRQMYPFIPRWPGGGFTEAVGGTKSNLDLQLEPREFSTAAYAAPIWSELLSALSELASIPLTDRLLDEVADLRRHFGDEQGLLKKYLLNQTIGNFANTVGQVHALVAVEGIPGSHLSHSGKHYSSDSRAVDLISRVYGVKLTVSSDDAGVLAATQQATLAGYEGALQAQASQSSPEDVEAAKQVLESYLGRALEPTPQGTPGATRPLELRVASHVEGVKGYWAWRGQLDQVLPSRSVNISHTSSDYEDLMAQCPDIDALVMAMARSQAKEADEPMRFRVTLTAYVLDALRALGEPLLERRFVVLGFGKLMGPSMVDAIQSLGLSNFAVLDTNPEVRATAERAGLPTLADLASEKGRALVLVSTAGRQTLGSEQLSPLAGEGNPPVYLLSLGSGRREFDMTWVEENSRFKRTLTHVGRGPVVEYQLELDGKPLCLRVFADGFPANLTYLHPTATPYASTTSLEGLEALKQGAYLEKQGVRGGAALTSLEIRRTPETTPRRVIILRGWDGVAEEPLQGLEPFAPWFKEHPEAAFFLMRRQADGTLVPHKALEQP